MPASPRPRRLHHWGSNALIYIAQECTTRGLRCLHLHVQEHNSRCVRQRRCPRRRELKKMPASPRHTRGEGYARRPPCARPRDTRVGHVIRVSASCARPKDARVGHVIPASAFPRIGQRWPRLLRRVQRCTRRLLPERQIWPRPRQLQGSRLGPAASIFQATFSPRSGAT